MPPDTFQAQAMVDIVVHYQVKSVFFRAVRECTSHLQWSYVSLVYSAGEYGELGAEAFKKAAVKRKVCVAKAVKVTGEKDVDVNECSFDRSNVYFFFRLLLKMY